MAEVFVVNPVGWHSAFKSWKGMTGRYIYAKTLETTAVAIAEAPGPGKPPRGRTGINYSTGRLESLIRPQRGTHGVGRDLEGRVIALPKHALYVHNGTSPHVIVPKTAPHLVFFWVKKAHMVRTPMVHHPGSPAQPFLTDALKKVM